MLKPGPRPSAFYLVLALLTLLFVIASAVLSGVHYMDFEQHQKFYDKIPGLPVVK